MSKVPEVTTFESKPGSTINLHNQSNVSQRYEINFGEYGSITFDALVGAEVSIKCGTKPPVINILETNIEPGLRSVD